MNSYVLEGEYVLINALRKKVCVEKKTNGLSFFDLRIFSQQIRKKNPTIYVNFSNDSISLAVYNHPDIFEWNGERIVSKVDSNEIKTIAEKRFNRLLPETVLKTLDSIT